MALRGIELSNMTKPMSKMISSFFIIFYTIKDFIPYPISFYSALFFSLKSSYYAFLFFSIVDCQSLTFSTAFLFATFLIVSAEGAATCFNYYICYICKEDELKVVLKRSLSSNGAVFTGSLIGSNYKAPIND